MFNFLMQDGSLTIREKELIALGIAIAETCKPCVRMHIEKCLDAGITDDEIIETAGVAVVMRGGPAYIQINEIVSILKRYKGKEKHG